MSTTSGPGSEPTRRIEPVGADAPDGQATDTNDPQPGEDPRPRRLGRGALAGIGLGGLLVGLVLGFLVVALGISDPDVEEGRIDELEATLEDRDAQIAELEARLAEAEAAVGERDADLEQQRDALEERSAVIDERQAVLDERQAALDEREAELAGREARLREADDADDGDGAPVFDEDAARTVVDRIVDAVRDLLS